MPLPVGSTSPSSAFAAIAASIAFPPFFITSSATWVASGCEVAAMAEVASTGDRMANTSPVTRSAPLVAVDTKILSTSTVNILCLVLYLNIKLPPVRPVRSI